MHVSFLALAECIGTSRIAGSSSDLQPERDIVNKGGANEKVGMNLHIQDESIDSEMSSLTDSGVTAEKHDSKSDSSQNMKTCTFGAQDIGSANLRSFRKRKAVDYSLSKQKGAFKSEISKTRHGECFGYPLSVLFWFKNSLQFFNCTSDMDLSNKRKKYFRKLIKTFTMKENDDLVSLSDVGGVKIKIYEGKPISLHSMSDDAYTVNKSCQNMFSVALSISNQDNIRASKCTDENEFSCCNLSNTFDTDLMKTAVIRDFDIDSLLQEMNIISVASLHDGDKLGEECKNYDKKKQTNDKPSDLSRADFKLTMEGHPQLTCVSLGTDECDSSKNSENKDLMYETAAADSTVSSTVSDWNECSDSCLPFNMESPMTSNVNLGSSNAQKRKLEDKCKDDIHVFAKTDLDDQAYTAVVSNLTSDPSIQVQHDYDKQSEPLDLTTSMSYKCKSDLNCTTQRHAILKRKQSSLMKTVNVNFAGRRGKRKGCGFTSDIAKQTSPQDAFDDSACVQVKPLKGSSNATVVEFEEMLPKRVLRNHSHITYFPDKKKQKSNKYDDAANLTQPKNAEKKDKNMDKEVIPNRSLKENNVEQRTADTAVHLTVKERTCFFSDGEIIKVDDEHKLAKFTGRKADDTLKEGNIIDHGGSLESVVSETDDNEKQNNVNAALAGLYYAETFKRDGNNLHTDSYSRNLTSNTALSVSKKVETLIDNTILKYKFTGKSSNKDGSNNVNVVGDLYKAAGELQEDSVMKEAISKDGSTEKFFVVTPLEANTSLGKFSKDCHVRSSINIGTDNDELKKDHQQLKENMDSKVSFLKHNKVYLVVQYWFYSCCMTLGPSQGAQWLSGRVLDSRPKGRGFEPHRRHCVVVLEQDTFILA